MKSTLLITSIVFIFLSNAFGQTKVCFENMDGYRIKEIDLQYDVHFKNGSIYSSKASIIENCYLLSIPKDENLKLSKIILRPEKSSENHLCISRNDLLLSRSLLLDPNNNGHESIASLAKQLALDVNLSNGANTLDLAVIAQYIDGTFTNVSERLRWVFYPKTELEDHLNTPNQSLPQTDNKLIINTNKIPALIEVLAIRLGDVSGNCR